MSGFDISVILDSWPFLAKGLGLSFGLTAVAMIGGLALGLVSGSWMLGITPLLLGLVLLTWPRGIPHPR